MGSKPEEKIEESSEKRTEMENNSQEKQSAAHENKAEKSNRSAQREFKKAFDVFKYEGRRGQISVAIIGSIFSLVITVPISFVTMIIEAIFFDLPNNLTKLTELYPENSLVQIIENASLKINPIFFDDLDGWRFAAYIVLLSSILSLLFFIILLFAKMQDNVNLTLDDEQKEKLKKIIESFKKFKPITKYAVTKILNNGVTKIEFAKFSANGKSAYFLPEGIASGSGNNFKLLDYKNLSVEQEKIEVLKDELPKGAIVVDKREKKDPVYGGWTYENQDGSKDKRRKDNPRLIDHYVTTEYLKYIKTVLKIDKMELELHGDYKFPSLKTKKEEQEEEAKRKEQERIKKEKEKEAMNKKKEWEGKITDKIANVSTQEATDIKEKELSDGDLSNEQQTFLERIVKEKTEEEKIKKEQEYIQNKKDFFPDNKLTILPKGNKGDLEYPKLFIRDENYEEYEFEEERIDFIVYKPEGMKGKRAYIKTDGEKNYLAWSGPIKIEDKSKFLRGDFEKSEEEVKPKEETTVLDQEDEISEPPEEKTEINDATGDIGAKLEKLTKLYEEGILTKEELQKKTDELISKI